MEKIKELKKQFFTRNWSTCKSELPGLILTKTCLNYMHNALNTTYKMPLFSNHKPLKCVKYDVLTDFLENWCRFCPFLYNILFNKGIPFYA